MATYTSSAKKAKKWEIAMIDKMNSTVTQDMLKQKPLAKSRDSKRVRAMATDVDSWERADFAW